MWTINRNAGRLLEVRIESPTAVSEVEPFWRRLSQEASAVGGLLVICTDLSRANLLSPEVAAGYIALMKRDNGSIDRSGFLIGPSAMFALQLERMLKEANSPARRSFRSSAQLGAWLGERLNPSELAALQLFLQL